jgi:hypothetical protein
VSSFLRHPIVRAVLSIAAAAAASAFTLAVCRRGITLADEGYLLTQAEEILNGAAPYRDLDMFVTPGVWYLNALTFRLFETSVFATRCLVALCFLATVAVAGDTIRRVSGPWWAAAGMLLFLPMLVWAFPAWSFSFYSPYSIFCATLALATTLAWTRSGRSIWLIATGIAVAGSIVFKQNYGVYAGLAVAASVALVSFRDGVTSRIAREWLLVGRGMAVIGLPLAVYLVAIGAGQPAFDSLVLRPFQGFSDHHSISYLPLSDIWTHERMQMAGGYTYLPPIAFNASGFEYWPKFLVSTVKSLLALLYWLPPLVMLGASVLFAVDVRAKRADGPDHALPVVAIFASFVFLGVFPRADYNHLINVYQPMLILLVVFSERLVSSIGRHARPVANAVLCMLVLTAGTYGLIGTVWFGELWSKVRSPIASPRAGVLVDMWLASMLNYEVETIRAATAPGDSVLAMPGLSMLPFLADRRVATRYHNFYAVHVAHDGGKQAAEEAEAEGTRLVISEYNNFFSDPVGMLEFAPHLTNYVNSNFSEAFSISTDTHMFLARRPEPIERARLESILPSCDIPDDSEGGVYLRETPLYRAIDHYYGHRTVSSGEQSTICTIDVPERPMNLRFQISTRSPDEIAPGTKLSIELTTATESDPTPKAVTELTREIAVMQSVGWKSSAPKGYSVDLARYAGRRVRLELRSRLEGSLEMNPLDARGFIVGWIDPVLEPQ